MFIRTQGKGALVQAYNINFLHIQEDYDNSTYSIFANLGYKNEVELGRFKDSEQAQYELTLISRFIQDSNDDEFYTVSKDWVQCPMNREVFENYIKNYSTIPLGD